jgi:hypothetical protein
VILVDSNVPMYPSWVTAVFRRDALHIAVMERHRVARILSFDAGFDGVPGVTRLR